MNSETQVFESDSLMNEQVVGFGSLSCCTSFLSFHKIATRAGILTGTFTEVARHGGAIGVLSREAKWLCVCLGCINALCAIHVFV